MEPWLLDEAASNNLRVGDRVLVWFDGAWGDDVWHERLLVQPVSSTLWFVATPEGDAYLEELVGGVRADSPVKCVRMVNGRVPVWLRGGTHLFASEVSVTEWGRLRDASEEACGGPPYKTLLLRRERTWLDKDPLSEADDVVWLLSSALLNDKGETVYAAGTEMEVTESDLLGAKFGIHSLSSGEEVVVERVPRELMSRFSPLVRAEVPGSAGADGAGVRPGGAEGLRGEFAEKAVVEEDVGKDGGDMRVLTVEYDSSGARRRDWRSADSAFKEVYLPDWPMSGPRSVLWLSTFFVSLGLSPSLWLERHLRTEGWAPTDRNGHELHVIAQVLELAAQYDQLNLGALACMERLCRRWQAILEAHTHDPPQFGHEVAAAVPEGKKRRVAAAPSPRAYVTESMGNKVEIGKQRVKKKGLHGKGRRGVLRRAKKSAGGGDAPTPHD